MYKYRHQAEQRMVKEAWPLKSWVSENTNEDDDSEDWDEDDENDFCVHINRRHAVVLTAADGCAETDDWSVALWYVNGATCKAQSSAHLVLARDYHHTHTITHNHHTGTSEGSCCRNGLGPSLPPMPQHLTPLRQWTRVAS